jgi:hypothetical protein
MYEIWTPVKVINVDHARAGTAGIVTMRNLKDHPDSVVVKFDVDGTEESVQTADLQSLG